MPIELKEYSKIKEKKVKTDSELLRFMKMGEHYTSNDIQKFLKINHTATLGRLKKLKHDGYVDVIMDKRIYKWSKIKNHEEKQIYEGWKI